MKSTVKIKLVALFGDVVNHPKLGDRKDVFTSRVIKVKGKTTIETLNTIYILEEFEEE